MPGVEGPDAMSETTIDADRGPLLHARVRTLAAAGAASLFRPFLDGFGPPCGIAPEPRLDGVTVASESSRPGTLGPPRREREAAGTALKEHP